MLSDRQLSRTAEMHATLLGVTLGNRRRARSPTDSPGQSRRLLMRRHRVTLERLAATFDVVRPSPARPAASASSDTRPAFAADGDRAEPAVQAADRIAVARGSRQNRSCLSLESSITIIMQQSYFSRDGTMRTSTTGTIIAGVLELDQHIDLPDNSRVRVSVETLEERRAKFQAGLKAWKQYCRDHPINSGGRRYTRDELHERR